MSRKKRLRTLGLVSALTLLSAPQQSLPRASAARAAGHESTKLMLVIVVTETVGDRTKDINRIKEVFEVGIAAANNGKKRSDPGFVSFLRPKVIKLSEIYTRDRIFSEIGDLLDVDSSTTLVFYYSAHGATSIDEVDNKATPILALDTTQLISQDEYIDQYVIRRPRLAQVLKDRGARLTILLTECCADVAYGLTPSYVPKPAIDTQGLFADLFLKAEGMADITSSRFHWDMKKRQMIGESSWVDAKDGGIFTRAFYSILTRDKPKDAFGWDRQKSVSWSQFFEVLKDQTNAGFLAFQKRRVAAPWLPPPLSPDDVKALSDQKAQVPVPFELPRSVQTPEAVRK
jgi:hypothetical protein